MSTKKAVGGSLGAFVILIVANILPQVLLEYWHISRLILYPVAGLGYLFLAMVLLKVYAEKVLHLSMEEIGIAPFHIQKKWLLLAFVLPVAVIGLLVALPGHWVFSEASRMEQLAYLFHSIFFVGIAAGFVEEMVFRGFILHLFQKRWNTRIAVLVPSFCFGILHILGRELSVLSVLQLTVAGTLVGVMFSLIMLSTHSVWQSGAVHAVWNSLMIGGVVYIGTAPNTESMMSYVLEVQQVWLTGGDFGVEASLIAMLAYGMVCLLAYKQIKNKKTG